MTALKPSQINHTRPIKTNANHEMTKSELELAWTGAKGGKTCNRGQASAGKPITGTTARKKGNSCQAREKHEWIWFDPELVEKNGVFALIGWLAHYHVFFLTNYL